MVDEATRRRAFSAPAVALALAAVITLVVGLAAGFLIAHYATTNSRAGIKTPDPTTVTCGKWLDLSQPQKDVILRKLNAVNDAHVSRNVVDSDCGGVDPADQPIAGVVVQNS